uniref:Saccharopine dehydrogenase NADP binding domain-containing protein n=1 Tax=Chrysotila carterae TaxID=13221 RepID=A0A7S4C3G2_CHRCT|mmetsp:Transcript_28927/g.55943  ORF Transcript_28927/g.55943 Transcript_28927/m.55943 type:complete len:428 (+) Transcript_28927:81-1364(+)
MSIREFDLVLLGCTGDAGQAVAHTVARCAPKGLRWALAGRSEKKLKDLAAAVEAKSGQGNDDQVKVEWVIADCSSSDQMHALASRTVVILSLAGPYALLGERVVEACVAEHTHFADITGEVYWVAAMKERYGEFAARAGVCICSFCGYDCIPVELSIHECAHALAADDRLQKVECVSSFTGTGGMPHGTLMTMLDMFTLSQSVLIARGLWGFLASSERMHAVRSVLRSALPFSWSRATGTFTVPHVMFSITTPVVHASAWRAGFGGLRFVDRQRVPGIRGLDTSVWTLFGLVPIVLTLTLIALTALPLLALSLALSLSSSVYKAIERALLRYSYPGDETAVVTVLTTATAASGAVVSAEFECAGDPGIWCTAKLAAETAMHMATRPQTLPKGFVTPSAMGQALVAHLRAAGVRIETKRAAPHASKQE